MSKVVYRPMTEKEQTAALSLAHCSLRHFDRRFSDCLAHEAKQDEPKITDKQANCLWRKVWKFRKQIAAPQKGEPVLRHRARVAVIINEVRRRSYTTGALDDPWAKAA